MRTDHQVLSDAESQRLHLKPNHITRSLGKLNTEQMNWQALGPVFVKMMANYTQGPGKPGEDKLREGLMRAWRLESVVKNYGDKRQCSVFLIVGK